MTSKLFLSLFSIQVIIVLSVPRIEHDIPKFKRGPVELVDEVALTNPESFDYDFSDDLNKPVDKQDLYDQFIDQLPMFHIFKLGQDRGVTEVPIVTRAWDTWFTPTTPSTGKEQKFTWWSSTQKPKTTTTETPETTTEVFTTTPTTTTAITTTSTTTTTSTSTSTSTVATATRSFRRPFAFRQPPPVFRQEVSTTTERPTVDHGPIWRVGGVVTLPTTTRRPTTPRTWTRRQFFTQTQTTSTTTPAPTTTQMTTVAVPRPVTVMGTRWVVGPRQQQSFNQNSRQPSRTVQRTFEHPVPPTHLDPISRSLPKPVVIQNPKIGKYAGPTYNCRVLNPYTDGEPSSEHDPNCHMLYPGLSLDGSCRCFYKVAGRDSHGCATGFVYACRAVGLRSISV